MGNDSNRRHAPATSRNRDPILNILKRILPEHGELLEIASGTGEHAAYMTPQLPHWTWQPSDRSDEGLSDIDSYAQETGCTRIKPAIALDVTEEIWPATHADAVLCCNMIHIAPWEAAEGLLSGAARVLPTDGLLILYGPFKRSKEHTAPSNAAFDKVLKTQNWRWGVRCLDSEVTPLAVKNGFDLTEIVEMPANNLTVIFHRR